MSLQKIAEAIVEAIITIPVLLVVLVSFVFVCLLIAFIPLVGMWGLVKAFLWIVAT